VTSTAGASDPAPVWRERLTAAAAKHALPSIAAAVWHGEEVVWSGAAGAADRENNIEASPATVYRIASITKTFTAVAVMVLRDEGDLTLDDAVARYIPEFPSAETTVRELLCHGSGLQRETPGDGGWSSGGFPAGEAWLNLLPRAEMPLPSMQRYKYSNLAYDVLGRVVSSLAAQPYESFVRARVLAPLGLASTAFRPSDLDDRKLARGYLRVPDTERVEPDPRSWDRIPEPSGALFSTVEDLSIFGAFLSGHRSKGPLAGATLAEMRRPQIMADDRWKSAHGLGPMLVREGSSTLVGHAGGLFGFASWMLGDPDARIGAVALTNVGDGAPLLPVVTRLIKDARRVTAPVSRRAGPRTPPPGAAEMLGRFWGDASLVELKWHSGEPVAEWPARPGLLPAVRVRLAPDGPDRFRFVDGGPYIGESLSLTRAADGTVVGFEACTYTFTRV
jgi:CubicO group peptidase (beta-lactamase class C family)